MPPKYYLERGEPSLIEQQLQYYYKMLIIANDCIKVANFEIQRILQKTAKSQAHKNAFLQHIEILKKRIAIEKRYIGFLKWLIEQREGCNRQNYYK